MADSADRLERTLRGASFAAASWIGARTLGGFLAEVTRRFARNQAIACRDRRTGEEVHWSLADLRREVRRAARACIGAGVGMGAPERQGARSRVAPGGRIRRSETCAIFAGHAAEVASEVCGGSHGRLLPGNALRILDPETGRVLGVREQGEIAVKGPVLMDPMIANQRIRDNRLRALARARLRAEPVAGGEE
jgi:acyl-CoA synthetase (AMP-forming)/AMP-acid ligase II